MANWQPQSSRKIVKRVVAQGQLVLDTPAHFGAGEQDGSELIILEDVLEKRPLLPGASLAGALRQYLLNREAGYLAEEKDKHRAVRLFGTALDDSDSGYQSRVIVDDALGNGTLTVRDGVKIDGETRTADEGALFSIQVWEASTTFDLQLELVLYEDDHNDDYQAGFACILDALQQGEIRLGARKHRGYGRCHVDNWYISEYNLNKASDLIAWLKNEAISDTSKRFLQHATSIEDQRQHVVVNVSFSLCDSILIREASDIAEASHLTSNNKPIVSGTAIAGALRARALKILNTLQSDETLSQAYVDDLFGQHGQDGDEDLTASRLIVDEYPITDYEFEYLQNRVKIDRFTSGAFETALFDEQPVFAKDDTRVHIRLELRYPHDDQTHQRMNAYTGLLLLLFKDLATEDLPLGGESSIGRGRLHGDTAKITLHLADKTIEIDMTNNRIEPGHHNALQRYVTTLREAIRS